MSQLDLTYRPTDVRVAGKGMVEYKLQRRDQTSQFTSRLKKACSATAPVYLVDKSGSRVSEAMVIESISNGRVILRQTGVAATEQQLPRRTTSKCLYRDMAFDSRKEAQFAAFLSRLGQAFEVHPITIQTPPLHGNSVYTPDFYLPVMRLYVEIKPRRPDLVAMSKCEDLSRQRPQDTVVCMFGDWEPGIVTTIPSSYTFRHADGFVGMAWREGNLQPGIACFATDAKGNTLLRLVDGLGSASGCTSPAILRALKSARTADIH